MVAQTLIENIIQNARWAPSGDNMQTWKFQIINEKHFIVHGFDTREHCVYDLRGQASQLAIGALLESIDIAASAFKHLTKFQIRDLTPKNRFTIDVFLIESAELMVDPLFDFLPIRSVQRRMMKTTHLTPDQKADLEKSVGNFYSIKWLEGRDNRFSVAWLLQKCGKLRLTLPEAYQTHSTIIEWKAQFSKSKIPDRAIGLDPGALIIMRWALKSWKRILFLNRFCFGTLLPRIELDLLPGIFCAAHFAIVAKQKPINLNDYFNAGRALQRFWLTATQLGLQLQPEMTPLIFSRYVSENIEFSTENKFINYAKTLSTIFTKILNVREVSSIIFFGRIGKGETANARSIRFDLNCLVLDSKNPAHLINDVQGSL